MSKKLHILSVLDIMYYFTYVFIPDYTEVRVIFEMPPTTNIEGFWGKPTATIDWCERNYEVSFYVAEWCKSQC